MQGRHATIQAGASTAGASAVHVAAPRHRDSARGDGTNAGSKRDRQRLIRDLVTDEAIGSQQDLVDRLNERGFAVTQATVSRDIAELGLVKVPRATGSVYVARESLVPGSAAAESAAGYGTAAPRSDERLRRILADIPVTVGRSGLILLVTGTPGTASVIAQAIDESSLTEQEGTLAGDNTLLVLFADETRLLAWRDRFDAIRSTAQESRIP
jgi:transcriptional regulator of arginine metabolism